MIEIIAGILIAMTLLYVATGASTRSERIQRATLAGVFILIVYALATSKEAFSGVNPVIVCDDYGNCETVIIITFD